MRDWVILFSYFLGKETFSSFLKVFWVAEPENHIPGLAKLIRFSRPLISKLYWVLTNFCFLLALRRFFSFINLGDGENSWITEKCQGLPLPPPLDRTGVLHRPYITPALYYTGPILHRPYITLALYFTGPILHWPYITPALYCTGPILHHPILHWPYITAVHITLVHITPVYITLHITPVHITPVHITLVCITPVHITLVYYTPPST